MWFRNNPARQLLCERLVRCLGCNMVDKEKIEQVIQHLHSHYGTVDNVLYHNYSVDGLIAELASIQASIDYLELLISCT